MPTLEATLAAAFESQPLWLLLTALLLVLGLWLAWRGGARHGGRIGESASAQALAQSQHWQAEAQSQKQSATALQARLEQFVEALSKARSDNAALHGRLELLPRLENQLRDLQAQLLAAEQRHATAQHSRGQLEARLIEQQRSGAEKLALLEQARAELRQSFALLANEIMEEKSARFGQQNVDQIGALLAPMRDQLQQFEAVVRSGHGEERTQRSLLLKELENLRGLNSQLSSEATHLTRALRGDNKVQGAWGEMVLERLLEMAGLSEGREFERQSVLRSEHGGTARPDVIVHLPEQRALVIDSKVSLTAYERAMASDDGPQRQQHLAAHVGSLRRHVQGLSERNYDQLLGSKSLDLVLMFIPIEGAFIDAIRSAPDLYEHALERRVVLVSPTTLLATLRAVHHVWRQEQRNQHAEEIARRAAALYDKLVGFVGDLDLARSAVRKADHQLDAAFSKLSLGRNNLIRQAERLRELGVEPSKRLPLDLLDEVDETVSDDDSLVGPV